MANFWEDNAPIGTPGAPVAGGAAGQRATADDVALMYRNLLGREASSEEIQAQLEGGSYDLNSIQGGIASSPEAQAYKQANPSGIQTGTATGGSGTGSAQDFIRQWQQSHPTPDIGALADALKSAGYTNVGRFMYGSTPSNNELSIDGQKYKVLSGEDSPSTMAWYTGGNDSPGGGNQYSAMAGFGSPPAPYTSNPNAPTYTQPTLPSWLSTPYTPERYTAATFTKPTVAEVMAEPDYQFQLDQGLKQINRSAAARGTVLNPGTVQALNRYGTDYATTKADEVLNRNIGIFGMNEGNRFGAFQANASNALNARQQAQGEFQANVLAPAQQTFQNQYASYLSDNARTLQDYLTNYNIAHTADTDYWGRLKDVSGLGLTASLGSRAS